MACDGRFMKYFITVALWVIFNVYWLTREGSMACRCIVHSIGLFFVALDCCGIGGFVSMGIELFMALLGGSRVPTECDARGSRNGDRATCPVTGVVAINCPMVL